MYARDKRYTGRHLYLLYNPATERIYGRPVSAFRENANLWLEAVHPDDREQLAALRPLLFERGESDD